MGWVKIDDRIGEHPKFLAVGPVAGCLYFLSIGYANRNRTDGFIPTRAIYTLIDLGPVGVVRGFIGNSGEADYQEAQASQLADDLVAAGLWEAVDGGYWIHDYLDYQNSAEEIDHYRAKDRVRKAQSHSGRTPAGIQKDSETFRPDSGVQEREREVDVDVDVDVDEEEATTAVVATTTVARPRPHVELVQHSEGARVVLEEWRRAHGKRSPPKLNPTQAQRLENAVVDLGVDRLAEAARYTAEKGLGEFHKCVTSAYTKRKLDEDRTAEPVMRPSGTPRGAGRDSRNPRDYFHSAARR